MLRVLLILLFGFLHGKATIACHSLGQLFGEWDLDACISSNMLIDASTPQGIQQIKDYASQPKISFSYQSYNVPPDILGKEALEFIEKHSYKNYPQTMEATLYPVLNSEKSSKPLVVLIPGSLSIDRTPVTKRKFINFFHQLNISLLLLDHFGPRGIQETALDQIGQMNLYSGVIDAFSVLPIIAQLPFIDSKKIYSGGLSLGGMVADLCSRSFFQEAISPDYQFAAHFAFYPLILSQETQPRITGAPLCYLVAKEDDICPTWVTKEYASRLKSQGANVTLYEYQETEHAFNVEELDGLGIKILNYLYDAYCCAQPFPESQKKIGRWADKLASLKNFSGFHRLQNFKNCCYQYDAKGFRPLLKPYEQQGWSQFKAFIDEHITYGGHLQYNAIAAEQSYKDLARFLKTQTNLLK